MKNILHSLLLPAALLLSGASAYIPARSTSPAAGTAPGPSLGVRDDASVAFRAPRSIPPTGLRPWVPPTHEAAGGHGPLGITPGLQDTLRRGSGERDTTGGNRHGVRASLNPVLDLTLPDLIPPSPAAMEIAKGITYPVDLSSGLLNIEIPLYEIVSGDIRIPIVLSYHASGLKPGIYSHTWLPQGWSLSVGPTLTRVIRGGPDEYVFDPVIASAASPTWEQLNAVATQAADIAPDEFYYSLPGHSGRLYFTRTPSGTSSVTITPVTVPYEPLAVSLPGATGDVHRQVDITDPNGIRYCFGSPSDDSCLDRTYASFGGASLDVATSWKIRTIASGTTGGTVSFEYFQPVTETSYFSFGDALTMIDGVSGQVTYTAPVIRPGLGGEAVVQPTYIYSSSAPGHIVPVDPGSLQFPQGYTFPMVTAQSEYRQTTYPSKISFPGGDVIFTRVATSVPGCYRLSKIQVRNSHGALVREVTLTQGVDPGDGELRLDGVTVSCGDAAPQSWSFTYEGVAPPRQTRDLDRWGYYNNPSFATGTPSNTTLVPTVNAEVTVNRYPFLSFTDSVTVPGGDRTPLEAAMRRGVLSSITYPTGGKAEFSYEAHRYSDAGSGAARLAGGLRIKSVKETAASGVSTWRHFTYGTFPFRRPADATGTGLLAVEPYSSASGTGTGPILADSLELYYRETACHEFASAAGGVPDVSYRERVWTDNSIVSLFSEHGSSVLYPYVMETVSPDPDGEAVTGALLHCYDVAVSHPVKMAGTPLVNDSRDGWTRGEEVSTLTLRGPSVSSAADTLSDAGSQTLGYLLETSQGAVRSGQVHKGHRSIGAEEQYVADQYKPITHIWSLPVLGRRLLASRTETLIEPNGTFTSCEAFTYDAFNNVRQHTVTGSRAAGEAAVPARMTKYYYPQDFASATHSAMAAANMVAVPVKTEEYLDGVSPADRLSTRETGYKAVTVGSGNFPRTIYVPAGESLAVDAPASDSGAPPSGTRSVSYGTYDRRGNAMERTGLDGRTEVWLWGYRGQYPVARVRGAALGSVLSQVDTGKLDTGTAEQVSAQLSALRSAFASNSSVHVETWTWSPLVGLVSSTDPSGRNSTWTYDALGRLTGAYAHDGTAPRLMEDYAYTLSQTLPVPESSSGTGYNSVRTRTMLSSSGTGGAFIEKTSYVDGLARVAEEVARAGTSSSSSSFPSVVTLREYDAFGRPSSEYRPVALGSDNGGAYVTPSTAKVRVFMTYLDVYGDAFPEYEPTPRDRVTAVHGPGSPWRTRGRYAGTEYLVNTATNGSIYACSFYEVVSASSLKKSGVYAAGELNVVRSTDEDGAASLVFTDKWGRTVLERRFTDGTGAGGSSTFADTYYVYDGLGLLRYVLSPEAGAALTPDAVWNDSDSTLRRFAYIYKYDSRGRMTYRKLPGAEPSYVRYDGADRPVFTQDGVQRQTGLWTFALTDFLGRECVRGTAEVSSPAITAAASGVPTVTFTTSPAGTALGGYTASGVTLPAEKTLLGVNYYDGYAFTGTLPPATASRLALTAQPGYGTAWPSNASPDAKGLLTGRRLYLADGGSAGTAAADESGTQGEAPFSAEAFYYDWRSSPVQTHAVDHREIVSDTYLALSFTGNVTASREEVTVPAALSSNGAATTTVTLRTMSYDAWDRLTGESTTVGDGTAAGSVSDVMAFSYDAVGRMTGRTYGNAASPGATAESLSYDVRDHLTGQSSSVFSSALRYTDPSRTATVGKYDGSVSEWTWSRGSGGTAQTYAFSYDALGRLTDTRRYTGSSATATDAFTEKGIAYDRNGNITAIERYGSSATSPEDNLTFTLSGNRISSLTNSGTNGNGLTYTPFSYDANGNTTHDGRTGQDLTWNSLNLISAVSTTSGNTSTQLASYDWYADGTKYSAERDDGSGYVYKGNLVFARGADGKLSLDAALTTGGRIVARKDTLTGTVTGYTVYHHVTDHLGSVRAVVYAGGTAPSAQAGISPGTVVETSDYLPFGTRWTLTGESAAGTLTDATNRWRYSGKEEQSSIDECIPLIDYGARMYDPVIARWMSADPMAEKYYPLSPYCYCAGNPVRLVDPFGREIRVAQEFQEQFKQDLQNVFGEKVDLFSFDDNGTLQLEGTKKEFAKGLTKDQKKVFNGLYKAIIDKQVTSVVYADNYTLTINGEQKEYDIVNDFGGGAYSLNDNLIVIAPSAGSVDVFAISSVTGFSYEIIDQNTTSVLFHEIGERNAYSSRLRGNIIDYENHVRRIIGLPKRPYDIHHNYYSP